jgi:hypothetical protein
MPSSTRLAFLGWRHRRPLNPIEPPWYGPVCPVVWEGRSREAPPYPDQRPLSDTIHDGMSRRKVLGCPLSGLSRTPGGGGPPPTRTDPEIPANRSTLETHRGTGAPRVRESPFTGSPAFSVQSAGYRSKLRRETPAD